MATNQNTTAMAKALLAQMDASGIDLDELIALSEETDGTPGITLASFYETKVLPALRLGSKTAWKSSARTLIGGLPGLCTCLCDTCMASFRGDSKWTPCACVVAKSCGCKADDLSRGPASTSSCLEHCAGLGDVALRDISSADLETLARWAELRAVKRTVARNTKRAKDGRPTFKYDGRSATEHLRNLVSKIYTTALADKVLGVRDNVGLEMSLKARPEVVKRSYTAEQIEELWGALFTSGSNDVELDMAIVWMQLETGARRGGPIGIKISDLQFHAGRIRLGEKDGKVDEQPASDELLAYLLSHAIRRGGVVIENRTGKPDVEITPEDIMARTAKLRTDSPVLYYNDLRKKVGPDGVERREVHPLTRRRFNSLWDRLKRELPWLDEVHGRPHDLRKTMGTFIERAHGHAVAQRWLRHTVNGVTGGYVAADEDEAERAHKTLLGDR
jgi:integrase